MKFFAKVIPSVLMLSLVGCAAAQLQPGAESVRILQAEPKGCTYLGEATGNQGNFLSGGWTSNENLETGARNELKNKVKSMGGNAVVILTNRAGVTASYGRIGEIRAISSMLSPMGLPSFRILSALKGPLL